MQRSLVWQLQKSGLTPIEIDGLLPDADGL
jgi:hypothetical protein